MSPPPMFVVRNKDTQKSPNTNFLYLPKSKLEGL